MEVCEGNLPEDLKGVALQEGYKSFEFEENKQNTITLQWENGETALRKSAVITLEGIISKRLRERGYAGWKAVGSFRFIACLLGLVACAGALMPLEGNVYSRRNGTNTLNKPTLQTTMTGQTISWQATLLRLMPPTFRSMICYWQGSRASHSRLQV